MKKLKKFNIDEAASEQMTSDEIKMFLTENRNGFIKQINTELYSVYELERTLAQIPTIKDRYFKNND